MTREQWERAQQVLLLLRRRGSEALIAFEHTQQRRFMEEWSEAMSDRHDLGELVLPDRGGPPALLGEEVHTALDTMLDALESRWGNTPAPAAEDIPVEDPSSDAETQRIAVVTEPDAAGAAVQVKEPGEE